MKTDSNPTPLLPTWITTEESVETIPAKRFRQIAYTREYCVVKQREKEGTYYHVYLYDWLYDEHKNLVPLVYATPIRAFYRSRAAALRGMHKRQKHADERDSNKEMNEGS